MQKKKILCTYCVPLIDNSQYINDINVFRASWLMHNMDNIITESYDLTFLVVFKSDDPSKKLLSSEECFQSIGIKKFGIKHEHIFHPNVGKDIGTYVQVARDYKHSDYDIFMFMSTSTIILHPMCITYLADALNDKEVGISGVHGMTAAGHSNYTYNPALRTNLFAVRKDILPLIGSYDTVTDDNQRYDFETNRFNIAVRVLTYGLKAVMVNPKNELLEFQEWNKDGGFLKESPENILASDRASRLFANLAISDWTSNYNLMYASPNTNNKRDIFK